MSFSARSFYYHNQPSKPVWANTNKKAGQYDDWLTNKLEDGLFDKYRRQDPTEPIEPTEPPKGETYKEFEHPATTLTKAVMKGGDVVTETINKATEIAKDVFKPAPGSSGASAKPIIYSDWSPVSKLFGMNQETAFGEHMANTAHQREVADLKAAGLNPVLGISGSGATSVSGSTGASSSAEKIQGDNKFLDILGATAAVVTAVATKNPMYGYMISNVFKAFE